LEYKENLVRFLEFLEEMNLVVDEFSEFKFESLKDYSLKGSEDELLEWYWALVKSSSMKMTQIPLEECKRWSYDKNTGSIKHSSGEFFRVEGYRITGTNSREVETGWDQPFLTQEGFDGGILGLIRKRFDGVPHYLVEGKEEPGNYNIVQISPTVQATFSNLKRAHKGNQTHYSDLFLNPQDYPVKLLLDQWTSEDGGRLFNKRNRSMLLEFDEKSELELVSDRFKWVSLYQLKKLIKEQYAIVAPHIRGILSAV
jgi:oxidase EvaA